jgi:hypothetical protein
MTSPLLWGSTQVYDFVDAVHRDEDIALRLRRDILAPNNSPSCVELMQGAYYVSHANTNDTSEDETNSVADHSFGL